ncbi:MAG: folate-binding protein [Alteraurantiacibacter sp.]
MTSGRLANRAVIRVAPTDDSGDAGAFLQGLLTNDVSGDAFGDGPVYAGLLTPQGKMLFDMFVWPDPSTGSGRAADMLLDCETDAAEELAKRLSLYRLRRKLEIAVDPALGVFWSAEAAAGFAPDPRLTALGYRDVAPAEDGEAVDDTYLAHRLSLGVPEERAEMGDTLWLETNAADLNGVSFSKGCYIGQENTARMNWRQNINRRLVVVPLDRSEEKRRKAAYPELGLAVDHLRVADIPADLVPDWMTLDSPR